MHWTIKDNVYRSRIDVFFGRRTEAELFVAREYGDTDTIANDAIAITMRYDVQTTPSCCRYVMWFGDPPSMATLAHECMHLTLFVMADNDVRLSPEDSEPACYYIEFLINAIGEKFARYAKKHVAKT